MKISIVTISYNQVKFLRKCIDSVLSQDGVDLEYIVVDPGSEDGSREIIKEYGDNIRVIFEPDAGPADGLRKGFSVATGDIYGYINSDDFYLPGALKKIIRAFECSQGSDVVCGAGIRLDVINNKAQRVVPSIFSPTSYANGAVTMFQQGSFVRSGAYSKVGGLNSKNSTCWDGELLLDIAISGGKFTRVLDDIAVFTIHSESISGSGRLNQRYESDQSRLFKKVYPGEATQPSRVKKMYYKFAKYAFDPLYAIGRFLHIGPLTVRSRYLGK